MSHTIQYDHEVNSFKFCWFKRSKRQTDAPCFDIINLEHLERDYINDLFELDSFLDIKITVIGLWSEWQMFTIP